MKLQPRFLWLFFAIYCFASLIHFAHNAEFINDYPNLPAWLTRSVVYLAWLGMTSVGVSGLLLLKLGWGVSGYLLFCVYASFGFAGLDHYDLAPMSEHSAIMNFTIGFEALTGAALLFLLLSHFARTLYTASRYN